MLETEMFVMGDNNPQSVFDKHFALTCPHCGVHSNVTAVSIPRYEYLNRFRPKKIGIVYRCDSCNHPIFLEFRVSQYDDVNLRVSIEERFIEVKRATETFELAYLPDAVQGDFQEALTCYSNNCFNAFSAMSRRTVQSVCSELGTRGADRVMHQLKDLKDMAEVDDETFDVLKQIVIDGHDGAHPHLPALNAGRATILL